MLDLNLIKHPKARSGEKLVCYDFMDLCCSSKFVALEEIGDKARLMQSFPLIHRNCNYEKNPIKI